MTIALILNIAILVMEIYAFIKEFYYNKLEAFKYYTNLSNLFALIASAMFIIFFRNNYEWVKGLRLIATVMLAVTLIVVITILIPSNGFVKMVLRGQLMFFHVLCPIISIISFVFFESIPKLPTYWNYIAVIPTILYGAIAIILNIKKVWDGPYPFLKVYKQPIYMSIIWAVVIMGGAFGIGALLRYLNSLL